MCRSQMDEAHVRESRDSLQVTVAKGNIFSLFLKVRAVMFRLLVMSSEEYSRCAALYVKRRWTNPVLT